MNSPVLITGCNRSGTSVIAGVVNLCGAFCGDLQNTRMYENEKIKHEVEEYLTSIGADHRGQFPLPENSSLIPVPSFREKVERIMIWEKYERGAWMVKDTKMCLMWKIWHEAFPSARWVIVRRKTVDIIESCVKTGFMKAFKRKENLSAIGVTEEREGWLWWIHEHEKRFVEMIEAGVNCKIVWPERMVDGDFEQMKEVIEWLGLDWNSECQKFVDNKLWKSKMKGVS